MNDFGVWGEDAEFAELVDRIAASRKADRSVMVEQVGAVLEDCGELPRHMAARLSEETGYTARHLYRVAQELRTPDPAAGSTSDAGGETVTFLERLERDGPPAFVWDELALTLIYLCGGNRARFRSEVLTAGYPMPSEATLSRRWNELPLHVRDGVTNGHRNRYRNLLYVRRSRPERANEVWEIDDFDLDLRVLVDEDVSSTEPDLVTGEVAVTRGGSWVGRRPHLTFLVDAASRFITGWMLLDRSPVTADVQCLLADSFEVRAADVGDGVVGGVCEQLVCDNAGAFTSLTAEETFTGLGLSLHTAPAYSPISKAVVERAGQTIQSMLVTGVAGVVTRAERVNKTALFDVPSEHWLEFEQLEAVCAAVIHRYNYERPHSTLSGRTPAEVYTKLNVKPRAVPIRELAELYLPVSHAVGRRKVQPSGVHALGDWWLDPSLVAHIGNDVEVRRLHHRLDRLAVFTNTGKFITMVARSAGLPSAVGGALVESRMAADHAVNRYAARAREAMMLRTEAIVSGGDASLVTAASAALEARANRDSTPPTAAGEAPARKAPAKKASSKKAAAKKTAGRGAGGKQPGGKQPAGPRPPRRNDRTDHVPARTSTKPPSALDVAERALTQNRRNRKEKS